MLKAQWRLITKHNFWSHDLFFQTSEESKKDKNITVAHDYNLSFFSISMFP